jgi:hypothetical protein
MIVDRLRGRAAGGQARSQQHDRCPFAVSMHAE